jgi:transposase
MFFDFDLYDYYVKVGPTDMRSGALSLAALVVDHMNLNPLSKSMFLFCSKSRSILKVLVWDEGFCLMTKKLNGGTFRWPQDERESIQLSVEDVKRLLQGQDVFRKLPTNEGKWAF